VLTLLTPLPFDAELDDDDEALLWTPVAPELVVVAVGLEATVVPVEAVDVWLASAGSRPETSTIAIISQAATNSAIAAEITRRRIVRERARRALRSSCPRARAAAASFSVMGSCTSCSVEGESKRAISFGPRPISRVRNR
jgi:hypothetical protein